LNAPREKLGIRLFRAGAGVAMLVLLAGGAWYGYASLVSRPIRHVQFTGDPPAALEALADGIRRASATGVRMESVREAARRVPWVRDASVRRRFPDALEIHVEAYEAVARWGEQGMVSARGEVFPGRTSQKLPLFRGPDESAAVMALAYPAIAATLAPVGRVSELRLNARGAWQVVLESGLSLELGRGDVQPRLARFAAAWPQLAEKGVNTRHADLRHPNGFAVKRAGTTLDMTLSPALSHGRGRP
jgi:cell division protein FtsQ